MRANILYYPLSLNTLSVSLPPLMRAGCTVYVAMCLVCYSSQKSPGHSGREDGSDVGEGRMTWNLVAESEATRGRVNTHLH